MMRATRRNGMPEPITIGALVATALSLASEAVVKAGVDVAVKDAYESLKVKISAWAANDTAELERTPNSRLRQAVIAEKIDSLPASDQDVLRNTAERLLDILKKQAPTIGLDIRRIEAADVQLGKITAAHGTGARIQEAKISGTFRVDDITVEDNLGKQTR
jgi:hypothetical protein